MRLKHLFRVFDSRNYRLYFFGQVISLLGTWMTQIAMVWTVYHLSGSAFLLGVVGFASQFPNFILAPWGGVWVDRLNRRRLLIVTQILSMLQSFALAALALGGTMKIWQLIALAAVQGLINSFDLPARQAFISEIITKRENLAGAIALNSSMVNLARLAGPALGGIVIAAWGAGICFFIDGFSYFAVIWALFAMKVAARPAHKKLKRSFSEITEGFRYVFGFAPVRALILLVSVLSLTVFPYTILAPVFAKKIFHGDASILGCLMGASGFGALCGAFYLGSRHSIRGLGNVIVCGALLMGSGLLGFSLSTYLPLSLACLFAVGLGGILQVASSNTIIQTLVEDAKRGRVMSIFTMSFLGMTPFGNLMAGSLAEKIGAPLTLAIGGSISLMTAFFFWRKLPELRRVVRPVLEAREIELQAQAISVS